MSQDIVRICQAFDFAAREHASQSRKGEKAEPYVNHLAEVVRLVAEATDGNDVDLVIAALLHDVLEDQGIHERPVNGVTRQDIVNRFGEDVACLVEEVTDDKTLGKAARKQRQIDHAAELSPRAVTLKLADKIANLRALRESPPDWGNQRRLEYFAWAMRVVDNCSSPNVRLRVQFDEIHAQGPSLRA